MATYIMFGKYTSAGLSGMSAARTQDAAELVGTFGGEMKAIYATLGETDLVCIAEFPGNNEAMQASVALSKMTGVAFTTSPAVEVGEFDKLMEELS